MGSVTVNANGTISKSFSIGKSGKGIVIYQGDSIPNPLLGNTGDIYIKRSIEPLLMKKNSDGWINIINKDVKSLNNDVTISPPQSETVYLIDTTTNEVNITISSSSVLEKGKSITLKDSQGNSFTNNINISTEGSETIDGNSIVSIESNFASITLISDGNNWFII